MANPTSNTKSLTVQWTQVVTRADPDWSRDHKLQVEDERRPNVLQNWQTRGPYTP